MLFRLIKYLSFLILLFGVVLIGLVALIDKEKVIKTINDKITSNFGKDINYDNDIDLKFFPLPQIKLKNIKYFDSSLNLDLGVKELNLTSTWKSILSLQPEISSLKLIEPELSFKKEELTKNKIILVNNNFNPFFKV